MEQTRRCGFLDVPFGRLPVGCFGTAAVRACLSLCLLLTPILLCAQAQGPLTLEQVRNLINIGAPDATVAHEIQTRGVAFTPDRELLAQFERQRAGTKTLAALRDFLPMLDEAKKQIPQVLRTIYSALDQGNPISVRASMSNDLANNTAKLDMICKPFTYRAHYVEAIIERPQKRFEVRVHVLFKPLEERAYLLWFGVSGGSFQLQDVGDPPEDWFQPQLSAAEQIVRKFVYAVNAGRNDVAQQIVTSGLVLNLGSSKALAAIRSSQISQVSTQQLGIYYYKGLKIRNEISVHETGKLCCSTYAFLLEPLPGDPKIVAWNDGGGGNGYVEDVTLEYATLKRFGISATPPTQSQAANTQPSPAPTQQGEEKRFPAGTWGGTLFQPGFGSYPSMVTLDGSGNGRIELESLKCGGPLTLLEQRGATYVFKHDFEYGSCERGGTTNIEIRSDGALDFKWFRPNGALAVYGVLKASPPSSAQPQDHYVNEGDAAEYLDLAPDGKFIWRVGGRDFTGTYELSSGIVTLRFPPVGATAHGKLENGRFNCCLSNGLDPTASALIDDESKNWVKQGESQPAPSAQQGDGVRFNVRHRHKPGFISTPQGAGITFCSGVLTIDKGAVQYYCTQPDVGKNRCERVTITEIKEVKYQENGLRIAARGGSWDFSLDDQAQLVAAHDAVAATIK